MAAPPLRRIAQVASHVVVACGAVFLVVWLQGRKTEQPVVGPREGAPDAASEQDGGAALPADQTATVAHKQRVGADAVGHGDEAVVEPDGAAAAGQAPVRIVTEPADLRVWHLTTMELRAEVDDQAAFTRFVWHFGDGSEPAQGEAVSHVFPESVADRHITLEAMRADDSKVVISRRLPIERLEVVPVDEDRPAIWQLPEPKGRRVVLVGRSSSAGLERVLMRAAGPWRADLVVLVGDQELADRARIIVNSELEKLPIVLLDLRPAPPAAGLTAHEPLRLIRDQSGQVQSLIRKGRANVHVVGGLALVVVDTRTDAIGDPDLSRLRADLEVARAYPAALLLSARPLSPLRDEEQAAPLAYRIYEQALRAGCRAVLSGRSELAYDARFGGVVTVAAGVSEQRGCHRPMGSDRCQPPTVTVLDVPPRGAVRSWHLVAPTFSDRLQAADLPAEVGKYRR